MFMDRQRALALTFSLAVPMLVPVPPPQAAVSTVRSADGAPSDDARLLPSNPSVARKRPAFDAATFEGAARLPSEDATRTAAALPLARALSGVRDFAGEWVGGNGLGSAGPETGDTRAAFPLLLAALAGAGLIARRSREGL